MSKHFAFELKSLICVFFQPKGEQLLNKLLAFLDKSSFNSGPSLRNLNEGTEVPPSGRQVGLENVQSRTSEADVTVQKKDTTHSVEEVAAVAGWIKEVAPPPASLVYGEPHKKTMHVPELQLDVKSSRKKADDVFGYVITDTEWVRVILSLVSCFGGGAKEGGTQRMNQGPCFNLVSVCLN